MEECLDDLEKSAHVLVGNMERLNSLIRKKLVDLEAEESKLRQDLEIQCAIALHHCLSLLECFYILYLLFRMGPKRKHLIFLVFSVTFNFLFLIWMGWRLFIRWTKDKAEFNLEREIGNVQL